MQRNRIVRIPADFGLAFANPEVKSEIIRVPEPKPVSPPARTPPDGPAEPTWTRSTT